jgi:Domain of unknown function (DUF4411)
MATPRDQKLYCFDTSAFLTLSRTSENVIEMPQALWQELEKMMRDGQLISHQLVFDEISSETKNPDFITQWIADKGRYFLGTTPAQVLMVPDIVKSFPGLIDYQSEREEADPWLIALAVEKMNEQLLFQRNVPIVVSQESQRSSKRIPAVCKAFSVQHRSLREFFDEIGLSTTLSTK